MMLAEQLLRAWSQYIRLFSILNINMPYDDLFMGYTHAPILFNLFIFVKKDSRGKDGNEKKPALLPLPADRA